MATDSSSTPQQLLATGEKSLKIWKMPGSLPALDPAVFGVKKNLENDIEAFNDQMLKNMQAALAPIMEAATEQVEVSPLSGSWELLKDGTTGNVYMGAIGGEKVIVKEVKATRDAPLWRLFREVYIQAAVSIEDAEGNHKHVTKLKGWSVKDGGSGQLTEYTAEDCFYIVLEYAGTELHTFIDDGNTMAPEQAYKSMSQIVVGLTHLHTLKFYHRDLKLENVAKIDDPMDPITGRLRLIDFGSSTQVHMGVTMSAAKKKRLEEEKAAQEKNRIDKERATQVSKSQKAHTRAPEIVTGAMVAGTEAASEKLDVWGLGIILFGLIFGKAPYGEQPATDEDFNQEAAETYKICWETSKYDDPEYSGAPQSVRSYFKEQTEAGLPGFTDMKELLDNMLQADPAKRWSLEQVRRHLKILAAKPLSVWLQEERDHADKTGKMINVKSLTPECGESLHDACGGVDIDIQKFIETLPPAKLEAELKKGGKLDKIKGPVQKKLFLRLYYELQYPLWEAALKKILPEEKIADAVAASLKISEGIPPS